jgi:hypothetical protein
LSPQPHVLIFRIRQYLHSEISVYSISYYHSMCSFGGNGVQVGGALENHHILKQAVNALLVLPVVATARIDPLMHPSPERR